MNQRQERPGTHRHFEGLEELRNKQEYIFTSANRGCQAVLDHLLNISFQEISSLHVLADRIRRTIPNLLEHLNAVDVNIDLLSSKSLVSSILEVETWGNEKNERREFLESVCILALWSSGKMDPWFITSIEELMRSYPEFEELDPAEKSRLFHFRNVMVVALKLIRADNNMGYLIHLVAHLTEGKDAKYVTGSGQAASVSNRELVYRRESGVQKKARQKRICVDDVSSELEDAPGGNPSRKRSRGRQHAPKNDAASTRVPCMPCRDDVEGGLDAQMPNGLVLLPSQPPQSHTLSSNSEPRLNSLELLFGSTSSSVEDWDDNDDTDRNDESTAYHSLMPGFGTSKSVTLLHREGFQQSEKAESSNGEASDAKKAAHDGPQTLVLHRNGSCARQSTMELWASVNPLT